MEIDEDIEETEQIEVQFRSEKGDASFPAFSVPKNITNDKLKLLLQAFKKTVKCDEEEELIKYELFHLQMMWKCVKLSVDD